jgi:hypothetical protein
MEKEQLLKSVYNEIDFVEGELKENEIVWKNIFGAENIVSNYDIAYQRGKLAWYENNESGNDIVKLKINRNFILKWKVSVSSMGFSYGGCKYINFCENFLVVVYADKHRDKLILINMETLNLENVGVLNRVSSIDFKENQLTIKSRNNEDSVFLIKFHQSSFFIEI